MYRENGTRQTCSYYQALVWTRVVSISLPGLRWVPSDF